MEFFATLDVATTQQDLQQQLRLEVLPRFCASIYEVLEHEGDWGKISTVWGLFDVRRETIRGGLRFTLPGCLNAVTWTVTVSPDENVEQVTVHCTINRRQQDADFVESLEEFVQDWHRGLAQHLQLNTRIDKTCCA